jgi:hypothetical protein
MPSMAFGPTVSAPGVGPTFFRPQQLGADPNGGMPLPLVFPIPFGLDVSNDEQAPSVSPLGIGTRIALLGALIPA